MKIRVSNPVLYKDHYENKVDNYENRRTTMKIRLSNLHPVYIRTTMKKINLFI